MALLSATVLLAANFVTADASAERKQSYFRCPKEFAENYEELSALGVISSEMYGDFYEIH